MEIYGTITSVKYKKPRGGKEMKRTMKQMAAFLLALVIGVMGVASTETCVYAETLNPDTGYGDKVSYTINYYLQKDNGEFEQLEPVKKEAAEGRATISPNPNDNAKLSLVQNNYKAPESQLVDISEGTVVNFYYYKWVTATIKYYMGDIFYTSDNTSVKGIDGQTFTAPLIDIAGYVKPQQQSITLSVSGNNIVNYYYKEIPNATYKVEYTGYSPAEKKIVAFYSVEKNAKAGETVTPTLYSTDELAKVVKKSQEDKGIDTKNKTFDYSCYVAPAKPITATVKEDGSTVIEYYYEKVLSYYNVLHYFEQVDGSYKLDTTKTVKAKAKINEEITPEVKSYDGYISPKAQKVKVSPDDDTSVAYYYKRAASLQTSTPTEVAKVGDSTTVNSITYTVTNVEIKDNTVVPTEVTISKCDNQNLKSVTIPAVVNVNGVSAKVTKIADKAFMGCDKLKKVTIGENIKQIGAKAFYGCEKLKTVTIKSKVLKKVGSKAFKEINAKATFKVPKTKKKAYKKLLKKSTGFITSTMKLK